MGFQSFRWGDLVGPVGQVVLVGWVDSSASLQAGREVRGESMGAIPEVQVVGPLVDLEAGHLVGPGAGRLVDPGVGRLVDPEVGRLVELTTLRVRWLIISIWGSRRWPRRRLVDWVGTEILAEIQYWGRLSGSDGGFPVEGRMP